MPKFDASNAECSVYTYKDGLLSAVAHDLEIRVTDFNINIDASTGGIEARFAASSLRVQHAMKDGSPAPDSLKDKDKAEIEKTINKDVLHTDRYGEIRFNSTEVAENDDETYSVTGTLSLHGAEKPVRLKVRTQGGYFVADVPLHQPDFGIKPYSAMMGTLKIKPDVRVVVKVPTAPK
jgi:hypothetical protein